MAEASAEVQEDALVGRTINDRFKVLEMVARGGMGRVYRAQQAPLGRTVALKVLDPKTAQNEEDTEFQARFFLEAATAAKLSHPNTVTVFDYGKTSDDIYFIVMEFVEGRTLSAMLKQTGPLDPHRAIHIAIQIARSVREAHGLGVIHRDLKPANVLITKHADEDDFVKVLDFGLVKNMKENQELTQQGLFMGSPKYMSPEQIQGGAIDARTDVYSLGCILYLMLTGRVPFEGTTQVQTLMAHLKQEVPDMVREDGVPIPQEIQHVILKCLKKDANDRFSSMNDVILALKQAGGAIGAGYGSSQSVSMSGEFDLSGVRHMPGTPSGGVRITGTPHSGVSAVPEVGVPEITVDEKKGNGKLIAIAAVVLLGLGGAAFFLTRGSETTPVASADTTPTPTPTTPDTTAAGTTEQPTQEPDPATMEAESATPPAPMHRVEVTITSNPSGAEVFVGDRSYGTTPSSVVWVGAAAEPGREVQFRFELAGHESTTVTQSIDGPTLAVTAALERERRVIVNMGMTSQMTTTTSSMSEPEFGVTPNNYRDNPY
jgi:serine/threonine-protein kinase